MKSRGRLLPRTIAGQIVLLIVTAVMGGVLLTAIVIAAVAGSTRMRMNPEVKAVAEAARIATLVHQAGRLDTAGAASAWLADAESPGAHIRPWPVASGNEKPQSANPFAKRVAASLRETWHLDAHAQDDIAGWNTAVVVAVGGVRGFAFQESEFQTLQAFATFQVVIALSIIFVTVLALSIYATWWIIKPLSAVADAARAFGNSPYDDHPLATGGPAEISRLAEALNEMRQRIRKLVDERTRMLAAISHDLRMPLTRIRLRVEHDAAPVDRAGVLRDVESIDAMIRETLTFLRDGSSTEPAVPLDLPSLLQTLCDEYADMGHAVAYEGGVRATTSGRGRALTRALTNIIDNGLKHGSRVSITLAVDAATSLAHVDIADDGPGIPLDLREKVFEPFFKADPARSPLRGGFGLGLTIARDIVARLGGGIALLDNHPRGLLVRLTLPALAPACIKQDLTPKCGSEARRMRWTATTCHLSVGALPQHTARQPMIKENLTHSPPAQEQ
jgi:signal transduction histidine kinase